MNQRPTSAIGSSGRKKSTRVLRSAAFTAEQLEARTLLAVNSFDFSAGFTGNGIQLNGGSAYAASAIHLADTTAANEARSAFYATPLATSSFTSDFSFQLTSVTSGGFVFAMQETGAAALGTSAAGLGYMGITPSAGVAFSIASGVVHTGLSLNGTVSTPTTLTGINLLNGDVIAVHLAYANGTLSVTEADSLAKTSATQTYSVNLNSVLGQSTGFLRLGSKTWPVRASFSSLAMAQDCGSKAASFG